MKAPSPTNGQNFLKLLPSRRVIPIIVVCVVIIGLFIIGIFYNPSLVATETPQSSLAVVNQASATGLTNQVYQKIEAELTQLATSSQNTTTNDNSNIGTTTNTTTNTPPLTATEALSQDFIRQYLAMKQSGQQLTTNQIQTLIPNLIANGSVTQYIPQAKVFTLQDLTISQNNSATAYHTYGNALGTVFMQNPIPPNLNELEIFQNAVNSNNPSDLANLAIIQKAYSGIVTGLAKITVPSDASSFHLALLNDFSHILNDIEGMQKLFSDPVTAIAAVQDYGAAGNAVYNDLATIGPLLNKYGATFSSSEPGFRFTILQ